MKIFFRCHEDQHYFDISLMEEEDVLWLSGEGGKLFSTLEFLPGVRISASPDHSKSCSENRGVLGDLHSRHPILATQKWFAGVQLLRVMEVRRIPTSLPVIDLQTGKQPLGRL